MRTERSSDATLSTKSGRRTLPVDVSEFTVNRRISKSVSEIPNLQGPTALFTTINRSTPTEFSHHTQCHNFDLQLSGSLRVDLLQGRRSQTRVVVPGHISLAVADDSFRCVAFPTPGLCTLHVFLPPRWLAEVREVEMQSRHVKSAELRPLFGVWVPELRAVSMNLAEAICGQNQNNCLKANELFLSLALGLLCHANRQSIQPVSCRSLSERRIRKVVDFLHAHIGEPVSLSRLAGEVNLSPYHFARSFRASVGVPPHEYLTSMRIDQARLLLSTTKRPLTDIAMALGFDSPSHFSTSFRMRVGVTPTQFRRQFL